jgi:hypothetical protein
MNTLLPDCLSNISFELVGHDRYTQARVPSPLAVISTTWVFIAHLPAVQPNRDQRGGARRKQRQSPPGLISLETARHFDRSSILIYFTLEIIAMVQNRLPDWINVCDLSYWRILAQLAGMTEDELRVILRPHEDEALIAGRDGDILSLRRDLDAALDDLTLIEIAFQFDLLKVDHLDRLSQHNELAKTGKINPFEELCRSEAFLRYVTAYQYFGVRMLAGRLFPPHWWRNDAKRGQRNPEINRRTFPIAYPPTLNEPKAHERFVQFCELLHPWQSPARHNTALNFLDGFYFKENEAELKQSDVDAEEPREFELWLRGLRPGLSPAQEMHFRELAADLRGWATDHANFYCVVQEGLDPAFASQRVASHPAIARFALIDVYWLRRVLRADVSAAGHVVYARNTWFKSIRDRALLDRDPILPDQISNLVKWIRSVFDLVCDLVQNSVEIADEQERRVFQPEHYPDLQSEAKGWREVFNQELICIEQQRCYRSYCKAAAAIAPAPNSPAPTATGGANAPELAPLPFEFLRKGWSGRLTTGKEPRHLVGLALSGGGIRSATFNLGVLQGLQEFDLLRHVDYLSTVSGGGFIGSWLVANAKRTRHWLGKDTCWDESITRLRSYSKYLAPITGILSADTWSMAIAWARNTFFIQLTAFTWLLALLAFVVVTYKAFSELVNYYGHPQFYVYPRYVVSIHGRSVSAMACIVAGLAVLTTVGLAYSFCGHRVETGKHSWNAKWVRRLTIIPSWIAAILITLMLWYKVASTDGTGFFDGGYKQILANLLPTYLVLFVMEWLALAILAGLTLAQRKREANASPQVRDSTREILFRARIRLGRSRIRTGGLPYVVRSAGRHIHRWISYAIRGFAVASVSVVVLYLALAGIVDLFSWWAARNNSDYEPAVFVFGPPLVLIAFSLSVLMLIGFTGRWTIEAQREWWTRFGAWLAMYGAITVILGSAALFGPWLVFHFPKTEKFKALIPATTITGWIGTVIGGLLAGKSSKTSGAESSKFPSMEKLSNIGGVLFLIGMMLLAAITLEGFLIYNADLDLSNFRLTYHDVISDPAISWFILAATLGTLLACGGLFSWCFEINIFGLNQFYRNRLVRCYLGATRWTPGMRKPQSFTKFDFNDDIALRDLHDRVGPTGNFFPGPLPIFNCTLNLAGSSDLALNTRHSAPFFLTPICCGCDRPKVGFVPTEHFAGEVMLGQVVSISGAAASPNMGYNTSPLVAFLLTMFNVRLGWWFPNPGQKWWTKRGLGQSFYYLTRELLGIADEDRRYLNVSDGGHFENLGVYELIRRRCEIIIACDAECDESLEFGGLGKLLRICETDFGAIIDMDVKSIREQKERHSLSHCAIGRIKYNNGSTGYLIYLKASVTGDEEVGIGQYRTAHPSFPHETTADQFFTEDQFESYRKLGQHIVRKVFSCTRPGETPVDVADRLVDMFVPAGCPSEAFIKHAQTLNRIMESFRGSAELQPFFNELLGVASSPTVLPNNQEFVIGMELIQLMEDVFMDLRLDEFWEHPDNRGWAILFMRWARTPKFQIIWDQTRRTFGIRFEYFCSTHLGLTRDKPIVRV